MAYNEFMFEEAFEFHVDKQLKVNEEPLEKNIESEHQRLPPLGACSTELSTDRPTPLERFDFKTFLALQDDNEQLNSSLFALTSHFAQVQFRLRQIINGPKVNQEQLLQELEEFAFKGCPDVIGPNESKVSSCVSCVSNIAIDQYEKRIAEEKEREKRLEQHLKSMITNLEETQKEKSRKRSMPFMKRNKDGYTLVAREKTDDTIYMASEQMNQLDVSDTDDIDDDGDMKGEKIPQEKIKQHIDKTMAKLINPRKAKDDIIGQVYKQINDMEKFLTFLKGYESATEPETDIEQKQTKEKSITKPVKQKNTASGSKSRTVATSSSNHDSNSIPAPHTKFLEISDEKRKRLHETGVAVIKKSIAVLQIFAISQFGCSAKHFQDHMMRKAYRATSSRTEYIKPFEKLRSSIDQIMVLHTKLIDIGGLHPDSEDELNIPLSTADKRASWTRKSSLRRTLSRTDSVSSQASSKSTLPPKPIETVVQEDLIRVVRGDFTTSLKELLQHGLVQSLESSGLSTKALVGCMSSHNTTGFALHIWEYFNAFYRLKHGAKFNNQPNMMLSEAFGMDVGCTQQNPKQSLLTVLHRVKETHETRKRSFDAMFKALVSAGLNRGRLAQWVRLVIRCPELVDKHYERWSYVVRSGFDEVLTLLEKLSSLTFFLPEDLAIRHLLKNINEFGDP